MKLFLAGPSFDPGFGGPAYSVPRLGSALASRGISVALWAPDGSAMTSPTVPSAPGLVPMTGTLSEAIARFGMPDIIHDNGIWMPHDHRIAGLARAHNIPRLVSLRGMLQPWAINHRRWKKKLAWALYQGRDIRAADMLHATVEGEAESARALGLEGPFCVIPNGVDLPRPITRAQVAKPRRTALFLSRVHAQKGLPMLLDAWAALRPQGWELIIAGPDDTGHSAELAHQIARLKLGGEVELRGAVYDEEKAALFARADIFVLPTYSENFGIAIAEALAYGVPVLTTRGAPWELLVTHDCGWWVDPTEEAILAGLRTAIRLPDGVRQDMGKRGAATVAERFEWGGIAMQFHQQYLALTA